MAKTDEGKVKDEVKNVLMKWQRDHQIRSWWPVPGGYGESTIDCHVVYCGRSIAIEVKKHKGATTALQRKFLREHAQAGGVSIVIEGDPQGPARNLHLLVFILDNITNFNGSPTEVYW